MSKSKYTAVHNFTFKVLKLSPTEALIFSYIQGFKAKGYYGSLDTLAASFNVSKRTVIKTLQLLTNKEYLIKKRKGVFIIYWVNGPYIQEIREKNHETKEVDPNNLGFDDEIFASLSEDNTHNVAPNIANNVSPDYQKDSKTLQNSVVDSANSATNHHNKKNNKDNIIINNESEWFDSDFDFSFVRWVNWKSEDTDFIKSLRDAVGFGWTKGLSDFDSWRRDLVDTNYRVTKPEAFFKSNLLEYIGAKKDHRGIPIALAGKKYYKTLWDDIEWSNWQDPESFKKDILNICNNYPMEKIRYDYLKTKEIIIRTPQVFWIPKLSKHFFDDYIKPTNGKLELI